MRLPNHLGDACMASAALDLLASRGHALTLVGRSWARDLYAGYPWPMLPLPAGRLARLRALYRLAHTLARATPALLLTNSFSSALEMRLAGLRPLGYDTDGRGWLLSRSFAVPDRWGRDMHTAEYYHWLARCVIDRPVPPPTRIALQLAPTAATHARWVLDAAAVRPPYVMLCPVAIGLHHGQVKAWDGFSRLCEELVQRGHRVVACPGPGEHDAVAAAVPQAVLLGETDVAGFAGLLAQAQLVVANDSGAGHLAAAVGAHLISVFGVTELERTRPLGENVQVLGSASGWPDYEEVRSAVFAALAR
ncbi:MAG: heptosyltransferase [Burkholderiaceae bacterium]|nr:heptosyltransferase [Burkholderiaceae bacterium]